MREGVYRILLFLGGGVGGGGISWLAEQLSTKKKLSSI
jgi:hypothetical protein